ncbi:MAG: primosomal replication protein N [Burkholderiales bacterium]
MTNEFVLSGELTAIEPLRYTPAGIPLLNFRLLHRSQQAEAGLKRQVECEVNGVAMAEVAVALSGLKPGQAARVKGFLNRKNRMSAQLVLHATDAQAIKE